MECCAFTFLQAQCTALATRCLQRKADALISQAATRGYDWLTAKEVSYEICRADLPKVASILEGPEDLVDQEFYDAPVEPKLNVLDDFKSCPIIFLGCNGHRKSKLINALRALRDLPPVAAGAPTRHVQKVEMNVKGWSLKGVHEKVILIDTPGWQLGEDPADLPKISSARWPLLVLVHDADRVERDVKNRSFLEHLKRLLQAAEGQSLLPVLSNSQSCHDLAAAKQALSYELEKMNRGDRVRVAEVMDWNDSAQPVLEKLRTICKHDLETDAMRHEVLERLDASLAALESSGFNSQRRVWASARLRGLRVHLPGTFKQDEVPQALKQLREAKREELPECSKDWHKHKMRRERCKPRQEDARRVATPLCPPPRRPVR